MSYSDALELRILDSAFGGATFTPDATLHIGLSSTDPGETGATNTEPSSGGYLRAAVTNNSTNFPLGLPKDNGTVISFPTPSAPWLSGNPLTHFAVWNHATLTAAANFLGSAALAVANPALTGNLISFPIGSLVITLGTLGFSDSLALRFLDSAFGGAAYTPDATHHISLSSTDPGPTGSTNTEPSGGNYQAVAVTNNATTWPLGIPKDNGIVVTFNTPSANWLAGVNLTHFAVWNHATLRAPANFLGRGALAVPNPALTGNLISFPIGSLVVNLD